MCVRIFSLVALIVLTTRPAAGQARGAQLVTGASLASLGVYTAFADRDCGNHPQTVLQNGRCEWRNAGGRFVGVPPELPKVQVASGLAAAGIGGLMASGVWAPSRTVDALFTAGAGVMLLAVARSENHVPGTVHIEAAGRRFTLCPRGHGSYGAEFDLPECRHTSFNRLNAMWAGIATLGLGRPVAVARRAETGTEHRGPTQRDKGQQDHRVLTGRSACAPRPLLRMQQHGGAANLPCVQWLSLIERRIPCSLASRCSSAECCF